MYICTRTRMSVEWDPAKALANLRKHGVRFVDAVDALEDDAAITIGEDHESEDRWVTIGMDSLARIMRRTYEERIRLQ